MINVIPNSYADILVLYVVGLVAFFIIDMLWLGVIAKSFYAKNLEEIMAPSIRWNAAILFYLLFVAGLIIFAVVPAIASQNVIVAALLGGLYGFFAYMTYDLTNRATLKEWPLMLTIVDIAWGTLLSATTTCVVYLAHFVVV